MQINPNRAQKAKGPALSGVRPREVISQDFFDMGLNPRLSRQAIKHLCRYPANECRELIRKMSNTRRRIAFDLVRLDPWKKVAGLDIANIEPGLFLESIEGMTLDLTGLKKKVGDSERRKQVAAFVASSGPAISTVRREALPKPTFKPEDVITEEGLYRSIANPLFSAKYPFPSNWMDYKRLIRTATGGSFAFPGDSMALPSYTEHLYGVRGEGVFAAPLIRGGHRFETAVFSPPETAPHFKERLIFDLDLMAQEADLATYGNLGSWPRLEYHERRWFSSKTLGMVFFEDMPVAYAVASPFDAKFEGNPVTCAFIHGAMTRRKFQGMGLSSFLLRQILLSLLWENVNSNEGKNMFIDKSGDRENRRFWMWTIAHSGRFPIYRLAVELFFKEHGRLTDADIALRQSIVEKADSIITGGDRGDRPLVMVDRNHWRDERVYLPRNRPVDKDGRAIILDREVEKGPELFKSYLDAIGGERGIEEGHSLYHLYQSTPWVSVYTKMREWERELKLRFKLAGDAVIRRSGG